MPFVALTAGMPAKLRAYRQSSKVHDFPPLSDKTPQNRDPSSHHGGTRMPMLAKIVHLSIFSVRNPHHMAKNWSVATAKETWDSFSMFRSPGEAGLVYCVCM